MTAYEIIQTREGRWHICDAFAQPLETAHSHFDAIRKMRIRQGLPTCHDLLVDQGAYIWEHVDADFDDGDAENGPGSFGTPAFDIYEGEYDRWVFSDGKLVAQEARNFAEEAFFEEMQRENDQLQYNPNRTGARQ